MSEAVALLGAAGFVAPRHMKAIAETGNKLVLAHDPHDSVGVLDAHFPEAEFVTDEEAFWGRVKALKVGWVVICSPNHVHAQQTCRALRAGANVLCEKPMALTARELEEISEVEQETSQRAYSVLQLRLHPAMEPLRCLQPSRRRSGEVTYITRRGPWYAASWKGDPDLSGGVGMNIGVHFFDLLSSLFGPPTRVLVSVAAPDHMRGVLALPGVDVHWHLSLRAEDLPEGVICHRRLVIGDTEADFSTGFTDLHTEVYARTLAGDGFGVDAVTPAIALVEKIQHAATTPSLLSTWVELGPGRRP